MIVYMINETVHTAIEAFPAIGVAAGSAVGAAMTWETKRNVANNRENAGLTAHTDVQGNQSLYRRIATPALVFVGLMGVTGGLAEVAYNSDEITVTSRPAVGMVVDHSFEASEVSNGGDGSVKKIDGIASRVLGNEKVDATVYAAHGQTYRTFNTAKKLKEDGSGNNPSGGQSMSRPVADAIKNVYSRSSSVESTSLSSTQDHNAAVFVMTDGNSIGSVNEVVRLSKSKGNVPIYIADSGSTTKLSDIKNSKDLKSISTQTHGQYWHMSKKSDGIESTIADSIKPHEIKVGNEEQRILLAMFALALGGMSLKMYQSMRDDTFNTKIN